MILCITLSLASLGKWDLDGRNQAAKLPQRQSMIQFLTFHTLASSHSDNDEDWSLLGCQTVLTGKQSPALWRHCALPKCQYVSISKYWNTSQRISTVPSNEVFITTAVMCIVFQYGTGHIDYFNMFLSQNFKAVRICEISSSHTGAVEDSSVLGYKTSVNIHQTTRCHMR